MPPPEILRCSLGLELLLSSHSGDHNVQPNWWAAVVRNAVICDLGILLHSFPCGCMWGFNESTQFNCLDYRQQSIKGSYYFCFPKSLNSGKVGSIQENSTPRKVLQNSGKPGSIFLKRLNCFGDGVRGRQTASRGLGSPRWGRGTGRRAKPGGRPLPPAARPRRQPGRAPGDRQRWPRFLPPPRFRGEVRAPGPPSPCWAVAGLGPCRGRGRGLRPGRRLQRSAAKRRRGVTKRGWPRAGLLRAGCFTESTTGAQRGLAECQKSVSFPLRNEYWLAGAGLPFISWEKDQLEVAGLQRPRETGGLGPALGLSQELVEMG